MDGILRCARYAFSPNKLHLCGPDANREVFSYIERGISDPGLEKIIGQFRTLFPYLKHIAEINKIQDPFNDKVVEAYWIGNNLLENIGKNSFYRYLADKQKIRHDKAVGSGAVPHHSFHVFEVWKQKKDFDSEINIEKIDNCRISWGAIEKVDGPFLFVKTKPLLYAGDKLILGTPVVKKINRIFSMHNDIEQLKIGDIITMHWNMPCEVITPMQAMMLDKYTLRHIEITDLKT